MRLPCVGRLAETATIKFQRNSQMMCRQLQCYFGVFFLAASLSGCAVVAVTDAAVTVAATAVKVGAAVVETTVDVAASGVRAVVGSNDNKK